MFGVKHESIKILDPITVDTSEYFLLVFFSQYIAYTFFFR